MNRLPKQATLAAAGIFFALMVWIMALQQSEASVLVPRADIVAGMPLSAELLVARTMRAVDLPAGAVIALDEAVGKTASSTLYAGLPIARAALTAASGGRVLPSGQRLAASEVLLPLNLDQRHGPSAALVHPGDQVDLVWVNAGEGASARILLSNVRIAEIAGGDGGPLLFLIVTREEAVRLAFALTQGQLFASLLSPDAPVPEGPVIYTPRGGPLPTRSSGPAPLPTIAPTRTPAPSVSPVPSNGARTVPATSIAPRVP